MTEWYDIAPADAVGIDLTKRLDITAPLTTEGERCPWPWEPQQLVGAPMGQYHCGYCGEMVLAGMRHIDYADTDGPPPDATADDDTDDDTDAPEW